MGAPSALDVLLFKLGGNESTIHLLNIPWLTRILQIPLLTSKTTWWRSRSRPWLSSRLQRADGARYHLSWWCSSKRNPILSSWGYAPSSLDANGIIHFQSVVISVTIQTDNKWASRIARTLHLLLQDLRPSLGNGSFCNEFPEEWVTVAAALQINPPRRIQCYLEEDDWTSLVFVRRVESPYRCLTTMSMS